MSIKSLILASVGGGAAYVLLKAVKAQQPDNSPEVVYVTQPAPQQSSGNKWLPFLDLALGLLDGNTQQPIFSNSGGGSGLADLVTSSVGLGGGGWAPLLTLIRNAESNGDYNAVWGGIRAADRPSSNLTSMTVGQVLSWQDSIDAKYNSEAAGGYQVLEDTLRAYYGRAGLSLGSAFSAQNQDRLAVTLLEQKRGLRGWLNGSMDIDEAVLRVAKEWASFPVPKAMRGFSRQVSAGQSYYAGDGLNRAYVPISSVKAALLAARGLG